MLYETWDIHVRFLSCILDHECVFTQASVVTFGNSTTTLAEWPVNDNTLATIYKRESQFEYVYLSNRLYYHERR